MRYAIMAAVALTLPSVVIANPHVHKLSSCLADHTTGKERKQLAEWVFLAMGAHAEINSHLTPSAMAATDQVNKDVANILMRLMTQDCVEEGREAHMHAGSEAFKSSFGVLGQLAMQELMGDRAVMSSMTGFEKYLDAAKLSKALTGE